MVVRATPVLLKESDGIRRIIQRLEAPIKRRRLHRALKNYISELERILDIKLPKAESLLKDVLKCASLTRDINIEVESKIFNLFWHIYSSIRGRYGHNIAYSAILKLASLRELADLLTLYSNRTYILDDVQTILKLVAYKFNIFQKPYEKVDYAILEFNETLDIIPLKLIGSKEINIITTRLNEKLLQTLNEKLLKLTEWNITEGVAFIDLSVPPDRIYEYILKAIFRALGLAYPWQEDELDIEQAKDICSKIIASCSLAIVFYNIDKQNIKIINELRQSYLNRVIKPQCRTRIVYLTSRYFEELRDVDSRIILASRYDLKPEAKRIIKVVSEDESSRKIILKLALSPIPLKIHFQFEEVNPEVFNVVFYTKLPLGGRIIEGYTLKEYIKGYILDNIEKLLDLNLLDKVKCEVEEEVKKLGLEEFTYTSSTTMRLYRFLNSNYYYPIVSMLLEGDLKHISKDVKDLYDALIILGLYELTYSLNRFLKAKTIKALESYKVKLSSIFKKERGEVDLVEFLEKPETLEEEALRVKFEALKLKYKKDLEEALTMIDRALLACKSDARSHIELLIAKAEILDRLNPKEALRCLSEALNEARLKGLVDLEPRIIRLKGVLELSLSRNYLEQLFKQFIGKISSYGKNIFTVNSKLKLLLSSYKRLRLNEILSDMLNIIIEAYDTKLILQLLVLIVNVLYRVNTNLLLKTDKRLLEEVYRIVTELAVSLEDLKPSNALRIKLYRLGIVRARLARVLYGVENALDILELHKARYLSERVPLMDYERLKAEILV